MKDIRVMMLLLMLALLFPVNALAQDWGEIREASVNLNVRSKRGADGEHVLTLAKGQRVKVDFLKDGWVAVFDLKAKTREESKAHGYANVKYLKLISVAKPVSVTTLPEKAEVKDMAQVDSGKGEVKAEAAAVPAQEPSVANPGSSKEPVQITSDRMTYDETGKVVSFKGNVVVRHGELTLWADTLSAYLSSKTDTKFTADSVDRIVAAGNVKAKRRTTEGFCGKLTYFVEAQLLQMEQNPLLQDGPNSLTGEVIKFYIRENRSEVVGGKNQRVKAIFVTPGELKVQ